jgi:biopolymer transport protein ExbB
MIGLASHVLPLVVLMAGGLWLMTTMKSAEAQYPTQPNYNVAPRNNFPQNRLQPLGQPQARIATNPNSIPTIPAAATVDPNAAQPPATEAAAEGFPWGLPVPAFVGKIAEGGWLMLPLAVCSLIVFALSLERMVALRRGRVIPRPFVRRFTECVEDGQLSYEEATDICKDFDCPVAEVFRAAVRRWGRPMFEIEQAVMDAGDRVNDSLRRFLRVFHAISNVAPLLGLLGTVLGMIQAFEVISSQESLGRPEMLAAGISTALLTTAGGLTVAIPAYLAYMYFSSKSDRYLGEIDKLCQRVIDCISAEGLENPTGKSRKRRAA